MGAWDDIVEYFAEEHRRKRESMYDYMENPLLLIIRIGIMLLVILGLFVPRSKNDKKVKQDYTDSKRMYHDAFYKFSVYGVVRWKAYKQGDRTHSYITYESIDSSTRRVIECNGDDLYKIYKIVEIGDTILKPADTLLVKIFNSPKYEELNRYETFRKK